MGVDYEEYFGCDETGESVEDALEREMLLADDDEPDIDTIKDKLCTIDHSNVYSLLSACFASEDTAVRAHTYLQAIAEHARAIENEERGLGIPDEEIPF